MLHKLKKTFIPSKHNNFKPSFLEKCSMTLMLTLVILSFAIANIQSLVWIGSDWMVSTVLPAVIVDLTNHERGDEQLSVLKRSSVLDLAAQMKADDMAKNSYFAHYSPTGISPWHWFDQASYNFVYAGENLAVYFSDSNEVVKAWMESPTHRANIMNGQYSEIGVGTAKGTYKGIATVFVVQLFGTPKAQAATPVNTVVTENTTPVPSQEVLATNDTNENVLGEETTAPVVEETPEPPVAPETVAVIPEPVADIVQPEVPVTIDSVLYSDMATTSRSGIPAIIAPDDSTLTPPPAINALERTATQPSIWLQMLYKVLALVIVLSLVLSIAIEWRRQHPIQIAYAGGLLVAMALLFQVHTVLTSGVTIL